MPRADIDRLYKVFSRYNCPKELEGCPCCTSQKESEQLVSKALRAIPAPKIEHYAFKAITTWGTLNDYKYFLPRILELTNEGSLLCDIEITLGKFAYGGFGSWPADEREAVQDFIMNSWRDSISSFVEARFAPAELYKADSLLCGAAPLFDDVTPLLNSAEMIAPEFKAAYAAEYSNQSKRKLLNSFWDENTPNYQRVLSWIYPR